MKQDDMREQKIRSMHACKESFTAAEPEGKGKMMKRMGKKMTDWYIRPFGQAQNDFNTAAADAISALHTQLQEQQAALAESERRLTEIIREQRESMARSRNAWQEALAETEEKLDRALCAADPACRPSAGVPPMTRLAGLSHEVLFPQLQAVKRAENSDALEGALGQLRQQYADQLTQSLQQCAEAPRHRPILIICAELQQAEEAVKTEAARMYRLLQRASRYPVELLSVCKEGTGVRQGGDCFVVPEKQLSSVLREKKAALVILCDTATAAAQLGGGCLLMENLLLRLVGDAPGRGLGGSLMQDLLHLCEYDLHGYCVDSAEAAHALRKLGFRSPYIMGDDRRFVYLAEERAANPVPYGLVHVSEWDRQLKAENRHLIKGYAALKAYYQRQTDTRAVQPQNLPYPQNCCMLMEQQSIIGLLEHYLQGRKQLSLLDLSRPQKGIVPLLQPFGTCSSAEADPVYGAMEGQYDVITLFDVIWHYEYTDRSRIWEQLKAALAPEGLLLLNVPNLRFEVPRRHQKGWSSYPLYEVCCTKESFYRELADHGLTLKAMLPVGQGLYSVPGVHRSEPIAWVAVVSIAL